MDALPAITDIAARSVYLRPVFDHAAPGPSTVPAGWDILVRRTGGALAVRVAPDGLAAWSAAQSTAVQDRLALLQERVRRRATAFAGLSLVRTRVMGIVNVTPDSFSDGGQFADAAAAIARGQTMVDDGADILDIGGESTRPGATPVDPAEEIERVLPVIGGLVGAGPVLSVDSRRAAVMTAAVSVGATVINDVTALAGDDSSLITVPALATREGAEPSIILMHMQGDPRTMQDNPRYACAPLDVFDYLADRIAAAEAAGIARHRMAIDPGIGFGKTVAHNLQILHWLELLHGLGCPIVLGASRKGFIARLSRGETARQRLPGSLAVALAGVRAGVGILRVHDVAATVQALALWRAVARAAPS